jgi:hypothetical protein
MNELRDEGGRLIEADPVAEWKRTQSREQILVAAMVECRNQLGSLSMGVDGHLRHMVCRAQNVLSAALGKPLSSHGRDE